MFLKYCKYCNLTEFFILFYYFKILTRSYLTQLFNKECENENNHSASSSYQPVFVESLPSFIEYLPTVENVSYKTLRKLQVCNWLPIVLNFKIYYIYTDK